MDNRPIGFLDSGLGGMPYLAGARQLLESESFVYWADVRHFPYGDRGTDELRSIVTRSIGELVQLFDPKMIVVACNTASVVALDHLRATFDVPFVGVVPAIKPATRLTERRSIAVLATDRTARDPYLVRLISEFASDHDVTVVPAGGLVELIEYRFPDLTTGEIGEVLSTPMTAIREKGVEAVVLGCTHFIHIRAAIEDLLEGRVAVVDSVDGVARQCARICESVGMSDGSRAIANMVIAQDPSGVTSGTGRTFANYYQLASEMGVGILQHGELRNGTHR